MILILLGIGLIFVGQWIVAIGRRMPTSPASATGFAPSPVAASTAAPSAAIGRSRDMTGKAGEYAGAPLGASIVYRHPERGNRTGLILGTIRYAELWQKRKDPSEPWVPTGNVFTAHWLGDTLLYPWKEHLFLLDGYDALSDAEIQEHVLPHAKRFGQSDEAADVSFAYPPASWKIIDIGKFRVGEAIGQGLRLQSGATGRFVHAQGNTGYEGRVLVVEDYQEGSGGQDTAWLGWQISWDDLVKVG